jgi:hypothetical protein
MPYKRLQAFRRTIISVNNSNALKRYTMAQKKPPFPVALLVNLLFTYFTAMNCNFLALTAARKMRFSLSFLRIFAAFSLFIF